MDENKENEIFENADNNRILADFLTLARDMIDEDGLHVDFGHGKDMRFPARLAQTFPKLFPRKSIVYYDDSDPNVIFAWISKLFAGLKKYHGKLPENLQVNFQLQINQLSEAYSFN